MTDRKTEARLIRDVIDARDRAHKLRQRKVSWNVAQDAKIAEAEKSEQNARDKFKAEFGHEYPA